MSESSTEKDHASIITGPEEAQVGQHDNDLKHQRNNKSKEVEDEASPASPVLVETRTESSPSNHPEDEEDARVDDAQEEKESSLKDDAETTPDPSGAGDATTTRPEETPQKIGAKHSGVLGKFEEPVLTKDTKFHNPVTAHIGAKHSAVQDKFTEPVLRKERPTVSAHVGAKHANVQDKFTEPVLKGSKINTPTHAHVGIKHAATGMDFVAQPPKFGGGVSPKTASLNRNSWGKQGPQGKFKWVVVGGVWKKQYDSNNDGSPETTASAANNKTKNDNHSNVTTPETKEVDASSDSQHPSDVAGAEEEEVETK